MASIPSDKAPLYGIENVFIPITTFTIIYQNMVKVGSFLVLLLELWVII